MNYLHVIKIFLLLLFCHQSLIWIYFIKTIQSLPWFYMFIEKFFEIFLLFRATNLYLFFSVFLSERCYVQNLFWWNLFNYSIFKNFIILQVRKNIRQTTYTIIIISCYNILFKTGIICLRNSIYTFYLWGC